MIIIWDNNSYNDWVQSYRYLALVYGKGMVGTIHTEYKYIYIYIINRYINLGFQFTLCIRSSHRALQQVLRIKYAHSTKWVEKYSIIFIDNDHNLMFEKCAQRKHTFITYDTIPTSSGYYFKNITITSICNRPYDLRICHGFE